MTARSLCRRAVLSAVLALVVARTSAAQQKLLTIDDIYDPQKRANFDGHPMTGLAWIDDSHYAWPREAATGDGVDWL